ncbi:hypothetical protein [Salinibacter ruber]|uniref:hypothetical protein n=1 Tax=Salinibacter ruber TaxID=146919 RepID=UPI002169E48F|nr:hypothetical protein [Salinibacter ruber]MCS3643326.1 hypothetical protein [Salinibacter ruber]
MSIPNTLSRLFRLKQSSRWIALSILLLGLVVQTGFITAVHFSAGFAYLYFFVLTVGFYRATVGRNWLEPIALYLLYSSLIIAAYYVNYWTFPGFYGFTPGEIAGTDDSYFYSLVASSIPQDFPVRPGYYLSNHPYEFLMEWVSPHSITHPFDILFFNAVGAVFIPVYTRMLAYEITKDRRIAQLAFWLIALCPFMLNYTIILVRDGWTAALFAGSIVFYMRRQFGRAAVLGSILFFLRIASGLQLLLVIGLLTLYYFSRFDSVRVQTAYIFGTATASIAAVVISYPYLEYLIVKYGGGFIGLLFRENFLDVLQGMQPSSFFVIINQQPIYLRLPLAFLFFISFPFFVTENMFVQGEFVWRVALKCVYALLFIVYFKWLVQGAIRLLQKEYLLPRMMFFAFSVLILLLSQASMQLRHKVMVMPLFYILVAYGYHRSTRFGRQLGLIGGFAVAVLNIAKFLLGI